MPKIIKTIEYYPVISAISLRGCFDTSNKQVLQESFYYLRSNKFKNLVHLDLSDNYLSDREVKELINIIDAGHLLHAEEIVLSNTITSDEQVRMLIDAIKFSSLPCINEIYIVGSEDETLDNRSVNISYKAEIKLLEKLDSLPSYIPDHGKIFLLEKFFDSLSITYKDEKNHDNNLAI